MTRRRIARFALLLSLVALPTGLAVAQPLGTFRWQMQPYCNVITVLVTQVGDAYVIQGTDDLCGSGRAAVTGMAFLNPGGTVGFGLNVVVPGAPSGLQVEATISVPSVSGTWRDSLGRNGSFVFNPATVTGSPRPLAPALRLTEGFGNWRPFTSTDPVTFEIYSNVAYLKKTTTGSNYFSLHPTLPLSQAGTRLRLTGVEQCYTASTNAVFSYIEINTFTHTNSAGARTLQFKDDTDRTDSACRLYTLPTPYTLTPQDGLNIFIQGMWNAANSPLILGRTTLILEPVLPSQPASVPPPPSGDTADDGGTSSPGGERPRP
ncbi:MAG: hypothetical protein R2745_24785 [Vicinamibacterales bacterium]